MRPLVSICCLSYNHVIYLKKCLEGFLIQKTNFKYEILIHDDCSTDGTIEIIKKFQRKYPEIVKPIFQKTNQYSNGGRGINAKYNFPRAKGKYIALCEGDDYWTDPYKLQKQVDFLEQNPEYVLCFHKVKIYDQNSKTFSADHITREVPETTSIKNLAAGNYIHTPSVVFRNNISIPDWIFESPVGDWTLYMLLIGDKKIKKLDDTMAVYRITNSGIWAGTPLQERRRMLLKTFLTVKKNMELPPEISEILSRQILKQKKDITKQKFRFLLNFMNKMGK